MTTEEKAAKKAAEKAEKEAAKAAKKAAELAASSETIIVDPGTDTEEQIDDTSDFTVGDPQVLRPVELPLVIKPREGKSWTPEQQEYVNLLNGYAYKNPKKWKKKKGMLLARLVEIKADPSKLQFYKGEAEIPDGVEGKLTFKNNLTQK